MIRKNTALSILLFVAIFGGVYFYVSKQAGDSIDIEGKTLTNLDSTLPPQTLPIASSNSDTLTNTLDNSNKSTRLSIRGVLIDNNADFIPGGDILYVAHPVQNKSDCESLDAQQVELSDQTQFVQSDDKGLFELPVSAELASGEICLTLHASKTGYLTTMLSISADALNTLVEIELQKHIQLSGEVLNPNGDPQPNAEIQYWLQIDNVIDGKNASPCESQEQQTPKISRSGEDGKFKLSVAGGRNLCLFAQHPAWASSDVQIIAPNNSDNIQVQLNQASSLQGLVKDLDGLPIANLSLTLQAQAKHKQNQAYKTRSNAEGYFNFSLIDQGSFKLSIDQQLYAVAKPKEILLNLDKSLAPIEVIVYPLSQIQGQVVDSQGKGLAGVQISTRSPYLPDQTLSLTHSDADGFFVLQSQHQSKDVRDMLALMAQNKNINTQLLDNLCLTTYHPQYKSIERSIVIQDDQLELGQIFLIPMGEPLQGQVFNHRQEGIAAELTFQISNANIGHNNTPSQCGDSRPINQIKTDDEGNFLLNSELRGTYEVKVVTKRYKERTVNLSIENDKPLAIHLQ